MLLFLWRKGRHTILVSLSISRVEPVQTGCAGFDSRDNLVVATPAWFLSGTITINFGAGSEHHIYALLSSREA